MRISRLNEKSSYPFIFVDPQNGVHLLHPITGGDLIGTDNTCKTAYEAKTFWGKKHNSQTTKDSALHSLQAMHRDLEADIAWLTDLGGQRGIITEKNQRLAQVRHYIQRIQHWQSNQDIMQLQQAYPLLPTAVLRELGSAGNAHAMLLRPRTQDSYTRLGRYHFSVERVGDSALHSALATAIAQATLLNTHSLSNAPNPNVAERELIEAVTRSRPGGVSDDTSTTAFISAMEAWFNREFGKQVSLTKDNGGHEINHEYLTDALGIDEESTPEEIVTSILDANRFDWASFGAVNYFYKCRANPDKLNILTQFFMATVNFYCLDHNKTRQNFGALLDQNADFSRGLAQCVTRGISRGEDAGALLLGYVNDQHQRFGMNNRLGEADLGAIQRLFHARWIIIESSDHFDEFITLDPTQPGGLFNHQGRMCISFDAFDGQHQKANLLKRAASRNRSAELPHQNTSTRCRLQVKPNVLLAWANEGKVNQVVTLLLSEVNPDSNTRLFEELGPTILSPLSETAHWAAIKAELASRTEAATLQKFNEAVVKTTGGAHYFRITAEISRCLYMQVTKNNNGNDQLAGLSNQETPAKLVKALQLLDINCSEVQFSNYDGYYVAADPDELEKIKAIHDQYCNTTFLDRDAAIAIYRHIATRFGETSEQYQHMQSLRNDPRPDKMIEALRLIGVRDVGFGETANKRFKISFNNWSGYFLKADRQAVALIQEIVHAPLPVTQSAQALVTEPEGGAAPMPAADNTHSPSINIYPSSRFDIFEVNGDGVVPQQTGGKFDPSKITLEGYADLSEWGKRQHMEGLLRQAASADTPQEKKPALIQWVCCYGQYLVTRTSTRRTFIATCGSFTLPLKRAAFNQLKDALNEDNAIGQLGDDTPAMRQGMLGRAYNAWAGALNEPTHVASNGTN